MGEYVEVALPLLNVSVVSYTTDTHTHKETLIHRHTTLAKTMSFTKTPTNKHKNGTYPET